MTGASNIADAVREFTRGTVVEQAPMDGFTSMGVGGRADLLWSPADETEILKVLALCDKECWKWQTLGAGTNVIMLDGGIEGLTLLMRGTMDSIDISGRGIHAGAGASLPKLARAAARAGLSGLEFAGRIPGTVGGAIVTNAGAFGGSIGDVMVRAKLRLANGEVESWDAQRLEFGYRSSNLPEGALILDVELSLTESEPERIFERMDDMDKRRKATQPSGVRSAGSIFKNPPGDSAARLIDAAGLKGRRVGAAMVSEVHAGYIVNTGNASASDVIRLMDEIHKIVFEYSGVDLIPEVRIIGRERA